MSIYKKKYLIITAHPDDLEMGCGGLVAKVVANGGSVTNLILVQPSAEDNPARNEQLVQQELADSEKVLQHKTVIYDTPLHKNGRPNLQLTNNLVSFAESCIKDHSILITHWREDHHQDHKVCYDVARSIARKHFDKFWCMDQPPYNLHYKNFNCNQYIDITNFIDQKKKALECYSSYFNESDIDTILNYNRYRGNFLAPDSIAETFYIQYNKEL